MLDNYYQSNIKPAFEDNKEELNTFMKIADKLCESEAVFEVTFEDEVHRQWSCEFIFSNFNDAKNYLLNKGFIEKNRLFYRENYKWSLYLKAYITPKKVYSETDNSTPEGDY